MISDKSKNLLEKMRIDSDEYFKSLHKKFGDDYRVFADVLDSFDCESKTEPKFAFRDFWQQKYASYSIESELCNWAFELFNNLKRFYSGGVFELFKSKQAEWGAPPVRIKREDVPTTSDIEMLEEEVTIYRGLSPDEFASKNFAQSWTIDRQIAKKFAHEVYKDKIQGIVVKGVVSRDKIIYFDASDKEQEVIIEYGAEIFAQTKTIKAVS
ncbi:hypothetical protein [Pseudoalteromonas prydzensis]|uniref:hypothetical protein n=1 Tax=Pseudoalteromonas prydzensis TaxID=182141 RepID=UPI0007E4FC52|nr:hypothetical protein [Pseudoalteromonas prydzensis]MBE0379669.1 hypothetical protein [Pseudoalteromonas prydzensis ACAM 620]